MLPLLTLILPSLVSTAGQAIFPEGSPDWFKWVNTALAIFVNGQDVPDKLKRLDERIAAMVAEGRGPADDEYNTWLAEDDLLTDQIEAAARARGII